MSLSGQRRQRCIVAAPGDLAKLLILLQQWISVGTEEEGRASRWVTLSLEEREEAEGCCFRPCDAGRQQAREHG